VTTKVPKTKKKQFYQQRPLNSNSTTRHRAQNSDAAFFAAFLLRFAAFLKIKNAAKTQQKTQQKRAQQKRSIKFAAFLLRFFAYANQAKRSKTQQKTQHFMLRFAA